MASKTEIANWALLKLGCGRVSNIETEANENARILNSIYDNVKNALLQQYPWNFCLERTTLTPASGTPAWGYNYKYHLPSDYLAMREIQYDPDYVIEGQYLLTDCGTELNVRYHKLIDVDAYLPPLFVEALATKLAHQACERITQSTSKKDSLLQDFSLIINSAYVADAIDGSSETLPESSWLEARV